MRRIVSVLAGMTLACLANAENVEGADEILCAAQEVLICVELDTCYTAAPEELGIPDFIVIDIQNETVSTTEASGQNRASGFTSVGTEDGLIYLQGIEGGRAFSFVINEATGHLTAAVSRDGIAVNVFGACTPADN